MWPFSKARSAPPLAPSLTNAQVVNALTVFSEGTAYYALSYANMNGYLHDTTGVDLAGFYRAIESEPSFTQEGISYAVNRFCSGFDILCQGESFNSLIFGPAGDWNVEHREDLVAFRAAVARLGSRAAFTQADFDPAEWLITTTTAKRRADLDRILAKLEERKIYLKPLLLRAIAAGRTKYGEVDYANYVSEVKEFLEHYFPEQDLAFFHMYRPLSYCVGYLESWFGEAGDLDMPVDPIDFEHWCAAKIATQGWAVRVSKASGDQGIDIEAMRPGLTVAIQCKRYAEPIGNKAVQEAHTGAVHYQAGRACVIGTGGFTKAAEELARTTGVILLDAENISEFTDVIAGTR